MKAKISILVLQELIRKTKCNGLISSAVITLGNNSISTKGSGVELAGKIDGRLSFEVSYPCIVEEPGILPIKDISDLLSKTEVFEKEDVVDTSIVDNKFIMEREIPHRVITYDLGDPKHIPTSYKGKTTVIFNKTIQQAILTPEELSAGTVPAYKIPSVVIVNPSGKTKEIEFTAEVVLDSNQLKGFASAAEKISPLKIPIQVKEGHLNSAIKGTGTDMADEIRVDKVEGEALSKYGVQLLELFKVGFGNATLRLGNETSIHVYYQQDSQKSNYLLVPSSNAAPPTVAPAAKIGTTEKTK